MNGNLDPTSIIQMKSLIRDARWDGVVAVSRECIRQWNEKSVIGMTEFETLHNTFAKEYKRQGVEEFLKFIEEVGTE